MNYEMKSNTEKKNESRAGWQTPTAALCVMYGPISVTAARCVSTVCKVRSLRFGFNCNELKVGAFKQPLPLLSQKGSVSNSCTLWHQSPCGHWHLKGNDMMWLSFLISFIMCFIQYSIHIILLTTGLIIGIFLTHKDSRTFCGCIDSRWKKNLYIFYWLLCILLTPLSSGLLEAASDQQ